MFAGRWLKSSLAYSAVFVVALNACGPGLRDGGTDPGQDSLVTGYYSAFSYLIQPGTVDSTSRVGLRPGRDGSFYAYGNFYQSTDFNPLGTDNISLVGSTDSFVTRFANNSTYSWTRVLSATTYATITAVEGDASGSVYVIGTFSGTIDLDPGTGTQSVVGVGPRNMFLVKLDSSGQYVWGRTWDSGDYLFPADITLADDNSLYFVGSLVGTLDFDPGPGTDNHTATLSDSYVIKMSTSGTYLWGFHWPMANFEVAEEVAYRDGKVFIVGAMGSGDADPTGGTDTKTSPGGYDTYVTRLDDAGAYLGTTMVAGTDHDYPRGFTVDSNNNTYVLTSNSTNALTLSALDSAGTALWSKTFTGSSSRPNFGYGDIIRDSLAVDSRGLLYVASSFTGTMDFDPTGDPGSFTAGGATADGFVARFSSSDGSYQGAWVFAGSTGSDYAQVYSLEGTNDVFVAAKVFDSFYQDLVDSADSTTPLTTGEYFFLRVTYGAH